MIDTETNLQHLREMISLAAASAEFSMKNLGRFPATYFARTPKHISVISQPHLPDDNAKDDLARVIRLACVAQAATAGVFAAEAFMVRGGPEVLDLRPSESPRRKECVYLVGETVSGHQLVRLLPIIRGEGGHFMAFESAEDVPVEEVIGRFARLLSPTKLSEAECRLARRSLLAGRVRIKNEPFRNN